MREDIIKKLLLFESETYMRLYIALSYDKRFSPFECYSHSVDSWLTFKNKELPKSIYKLLCENTPSWSVDDKILIEVLFMDTELYLKHLNIDYLIK